MSPNTAPASAPAHAHGLGVELAAGGLRPGVRARRWFRCHRRAAQRRAAGQLRGKLVLRLRAPHPRRRFRSSRAVAAASRARARWRCASCSTACSRASCRRLQLPTLAMRRPARCPPRRLPPCARAWPPPARRPRRAARRARVSAASVTTSCAACRVAICRRSAWRSVRQGRVMRSSRLNASVRSISRSWLLAKRPSVKCGLGRVMACTLGISHAQRRQPGLQARVVEQRDAHGSVLREGLWPASAG